MSIWMWLLLLLAAGMTALMLTAMVVGVRDTFHQRGKRHRTDLAVAWEDGYLEAMQRAIHDELYPQARSRRLGRGYNPYMNGSKS